MRTGGKQDNQSEPIRGFHGHNLGVRNMVESTEPPAGPVKGQSHRKNLVFDVTSVESL
jgi:hypothetical protein